MTKVRTIRVAAVVALTVIMPGPMQPASAAQQAGTVMYTANQAEHVLTVKKRESGAGTCELGVRGQSAGLEFALTISQNQYGGTMIVMGGAKTLFRTVNAAVPLRQDELRPFTIKTLGPAKPVTAGVILKTNASTNEIYVGIGGLSADSRNAILQSAQSWEVFDKDGVLVHAFAPPAQPLGEALSAFAACNTSWR
jgi:hypothetical protein